MGLSQALSTGVTGLMSHQKALDNIGNNLANVNTVGYKKGVYQFATLLEQTLSGGMGASGSRGSVNPIGIGMGTSTGSINKVFSQGQLETTGSANDMAIWGNGFFVVNTGNGYAMTRDGSFYVSEDGYLMGGNGYYVQGTMAVKNSDGSITIPQDAKLQNLSIPIGSTGGMQKTSQVSFSGNLKSAQTVSTGLKLFGSNAPTVSNLQSWMSTSYDSTDTSWTALEKETFFVSQEIVDAARASGTVDVDSIAGNFTSASVSVNADGIASTHAYYAIDPDGAVRHVSELGFADSPVANDDLFALGCIPVIQEINTINGGNVQTSAAFGVKVPETLEPGTTVTHNGATHTVNNGSTYPAWFYESTGGDFAAAAAMTDADYADSAKVGAIWPNGINGDGVAVTAGTLPRTGETYAASLDTPLEHLYSYQGNAWKQLFPGISDGDEVAIGFDKGDSHVEATFVYNRPSSTQPSGSQQKVDIEQSYTLEHLLQFMGGDVDNAATACAAITPAMFGAPVSEEYPDGNYNASGWDRAAYDAALVNVDMATSGSNLNTYNTGIMGLVDVPPGISAANGGEDAYDAPVETAGAFTREGVSQVSYQRWNSDTNQLETVSGSGYASFNVSFVSNLGSQNALSNISVSYNNVNHKSVFSSETEYSASQGGSATTSVTFYDSLGNAKVATLRLSLVEEDSNFSTWRWYADCEDDTDFAWIVDPDTGAIASSLSVGTGLIRFDTDGNFVLGSDQSETGGIVINQANQGVDDPILVKIINGLNSTLVQDLDFSALTFTAADNDLSLLTQNGSPPGTLNKFEVSADGTINGVYSTGKTIPLGRLVIATVPNQNGLVASGDNLYYASPASGDPQYGYPDLGGRGEIRQYQLETSNVDLSEEFTKMIAVERGYQANSRIITTADEMLQELLSMVR